MNFKNLQPKFLLIILGALLIIGGLGIEVVTVQYFGVLIGFLFLNLTLLQKKKLKPPPFLVLYLLFLTLFIVSSFVVSLDTKKSLEAFSLFLGGGLLWVAIYNLKKEFATRIDILIIVIGFVFAALYFYNFFLGNPNVLKPLSLYTQASTFVNHNHLGDLWALVLIIVAFYLTRKPKSILFWALVSFGIYLLLISQSRSAYLAVTVGVIYLGKVLGVGR